jgi:hypothetical protein
MLLVHICFLFISDDSNILLLDFIEQSLSWEADSCSVGKEILCLLLKPQVDYHVHKSFPLGPILGQLGIVHSHNIFL